MSHVETNTRLLNTDDVALKQIRIAARKKKTLQKKKRKNAKHFLKVNRVLLLLKNLLAI